MTKKKPPLESIDVAGNTIHCDDIVEFSAHPVFDWYVRGRVIRISDRDSKRWLEIEPTHERNEDGSWGRYRAQTIKFKNEGRIIERVETLIIDTSEVKLSDISESGPVNRTQ